MAAAALTIATASRAGSLPLHRREQQGGEDGHIGGGGAEIPENRISPTTVTCASPPRKWPTRASASATKRREMPPVSIKAPARRNRGMASSTKLSTPAMSRWGRASAGGLPRAPEARRARGTPAPLPGGRSTPAARGTRRAAPRSGRWGNWPPVTWRSSAAAHPEPARPRQHGAQDPPRQGREVPYSRGPVAVTPKSTASG